MCSPKKLLILSDNICIYLQNISILSQNYCVSRETLHSLTKAFFFSHHLILVPSQKLCEQMQNCFNAKVFLDLL